MRTRDLTIISVSRVLWAETALASAALLKDLYQNPVSWTNWVLIGSWVLLGFCAFAQIYSDHLSSRAVDVQRKILDDYFAEGDDDAINRKNPYDLWVKGINAVTPWVLFLGLGFMILFGTVNFLEKQGADMNKKQIPAAGKTTQEKDKISKKGVTMPPIIKKKDKPQSRTDKETQ